MPFTHLTRRDLPAVLTMMQEYYAYDGLDFSRAAARRRLMKLLKDPALGAAWMLVVDKKPAGYLFVIRGFGIEHGSNVLIDELYIRAPYRLAGWGKRAVQLVLRYARSVRAESIHAQVERHNRKACRFWSARGFRRYDRYTMVRMRRET